MCSLFNYCPYLQKVYPHLFISVLLYCLQLLCRSVLALRSISFVRWVANCSFYRLSFHEKWYHPNRVLGGQILMQYIIARCLKSLLFWKWTALFSRLLNLTRYLRVRTVVGFQSFRKIKVRNPQLTKKISNPIIQSSHYMYV